jgi:hypothetical protein
MYVFQELTSSKQSTLTFHDFPLLQLLSNSTYSYCSFKADHLCILCLGSGWSFGCEHPLCPFTSMNVNPCHLVKNMQPSNNIPWKYPQSPLRFQSLLRIVLGYTPIHTHTHFLFVIIDRQSVFQCGENWKMAESGKRRWRRKISCLAHWTAFENPIFSGKTQSFQGYMVRIKDFRRRVSKQADLESSWKVRGGRTFLLSLQGNDTLSITQTWGGP